jgi:acetyl-CoA carboxylase biotin carboxyl carrier protein
MNIKEVKDLIHEVLESDISEFELEHTGTRLRLKRGFPGDSALAPQISHQSLTASFPAPPKGISRQSPPQSEIEEDSEEDVLHVITSPIVGTVFCSPSPGSEPFVKLGDHVKEGAVLCIVEAMKLMNEIPSDVEGEIVHIYIENGNPVEFGQKLFSIRPSRQG